jgi:hypothetical protein
VLSYDPSPTKREEATHILPAPSRACHSCYSASPAPAGTLAGNALRPHRTLYTCIPVWALTNGFPVLHSGIFGICDRSEGSAQLCTDTLSR